MVTVVRRTADGAPERVKIVFHHTPRYMQRQPNGSLQEGFSRIHGTQTYARGHTIAELYSFPPWTSQGDGSAPPPEELIDSAIAYCSHLDRWDRETGRCRALRRLQEKLHANGMPGEEVAKLHFAYRNRPKGEKKTVTDLPVVEGEVVT